MTTTDLATLERTADLTDRADRLMLADAYADAGLDGMAALVRAGCPYQTHVVQFDCEAMNDIVQGDWDEVAQEATAADHVCSYDGASGETLCTGADEGAMDASPLVESYEAKWAVQDDQGPFADKSAAWREGFRDSDISIRGRRWDHYGACSSYLFDTAAEMLGALREAFAQADDYEAEEMEK